MRTIDVSNTPALRRRVERPRKAFLWTQEHTIIPRLVETIFGNGRRLLALRPIQTRPNYYIVRIDSSWSTDNWEKGHPMPPSEWLDDVYQAVEEQFGNGKGDDGEERDDAYFPEALLDVGTEWWEIDPRRYHCRGSRPRKLFLIWDQRGTPITTASLESAVEGNP